MYRPPVLHRTRRPHRQQICKCFRPHPDLSKNKCVILQCMNMGVYNISIKLANQECCFGTSNQEQTIIWSNWNLQDLKTSTRILIRCTELLSNSAVFFWVHQCKSYVFIFKIIEHLGSELRKTTKNGLHMCDLISLEPSRIVHSRHSAWSPLNKLTW